jgi:MFS family permease
LKVFSTFSPAVRQNLLVLFVAGLLFWCSLASLLPTLPLYIKEVGATDQQLGWVMGAFAIGLLIFRPRLGVLADRRGRKIVILIGMAVAAIAPLGYLFTQSVMPLFAVRVFHGISIAAFTTGFSALAADLSPPQNRGEVIGYMTLVNPIGVALGPALGGFLHAWAGYTPLFLMTAGLGAIGLVFSWQVKAPQVEVKPNAKKSNEQQDVFWRLLLSPRLRIPSLVMLLIGLSFGTLSTFVPLFIQQAGVNLNAGLFYAAAAVSSFSVRLFTGRASDRYGRGRFISLSLVFYASAMLLLYVANSAPTFLIAGFLEGAGAGILIPMMVTLVADRSAPHERGRIFGLCVGGFDLGIFIAGPFLGSFAEQIGYRGLFGIASAIACLGFAVFVAFNSKDLAHSLRFALGNGKDIYALKESVRS